ncbi:MAG: bifunctional hydroxymethylpyrimidine kinase/phosphomethylpyrimidine kinase [Kiritimatiellae bacterium]|nr:bifunctional hydroxymethylpyrimidine kinase/phosphomethylpyrimidine kinase [Kiritimatiellia bacterium]
MEPPPLPSIPVALTIAGSDSGGGAGIQADLKVFETLGVMGATAITCVTAQNPAGVRAVEALSAATVRAQIEAVLEAFPVAAAKTGMLFSREIIDAVADAWPASRKTALVVDPVMVAVRGDRLLREDAEAALLHRMIPGCAVCTPNLHEAEILWGRKIPDVDDLRRAAHDLTERYGAPFLVKGGHLETPMLVDVLFDGRAERIFERPRIADAHTHGAGCSFSAALTAGLAKGHPLPEAAQQAKEFVWQALHHARPAGTHRPLNYRAAAREYTT